jgi:serine protease
VAGDSVTLDATPSIIPAGRSVSSYQWSLADDGGIVSGFTGATNGSTSTVKTTGGGSFVVTLTLTDNTGLVSAESLRVNVASPPSSGGGAAAPGWLLLLLAAVLALAWRPRQR